MKALRGAKNNGKTGVIWCGLVRRVMEEKETELKRPGTSHEKMKNVLNGTVGKKFPSICFLFLYYIHVSFFRSEFPSLLPQVAVTDMCS